MKVVIAGGTGQIGQILTREYRQRGWAVVVLTRHPKAPGEIAWDGQTLGDWQTHIEDADLVINLAGRTVNCRYTDENMKQMMDSRVHSTQIVGEAIAACKTPPKLWLQMSTATIYEHTFDHNNDEETGVIGGNEANVPAYWKFSVEIGQAWEKALFESVTPGTRKVALRSAMVMSPDQGGVFMELVGLTRKGLGGPIDGGKQYMSWIHERDFIGALDLLIESHFEGAINLAAPHPLPQKDFMRVMRQQVGMPFSLTTTKWMAELGAFFMGTDTELILKSRRVVSSTLKKLGYKFKYPRWEEACLDLMDRSGQYMKKHFYRFSFFTYYATVIMMNVAFNWGGTSNLEASLGFLAFTLFAPLPLMILAIETAYALLGKFIYRHKSIAKRVVWSLLTTVFSIYVFGVLFFLCAWAYGSVEGWLQGEKFHDVVLSDLVGIFAIYPLVGVVYGLPATLVFATWMGRDAHHKMEEAQYTLAYQR